MEKSKYYKSVCKGISGAMILCLVGFTLLSVVMTKIDISKTMYNFIYSSIALISLCAGAISGAKKNGCKGWLVGAGISIGYYFVLFFTASILKKEFNFQIIDAVKLAGVMFIGIISGILGINL